MNIVYDSNTDRLHVALGNDDWEHHRIQPGIILLVETLTKYHLYSYEIYLIRKLELGRSMQLDEYLETYYRFIACFGLNPYI